MSHSFIGSSNLLKGLRKRFLYVHIYALLLTLVLIANTHNIAAVRLYRAAPVYPSIAIHIYGAGCYSIYLVQALL